MARSIHDPTWRSEIDRKKRDAAIARGEKHYVSEKPCNHGHEPIRYVSSGSCRACHKIASRAVNGGRMRDAETHCRALVHEFVELYGATEARRFGLPEAYFPPAAAAVKKKRDPLPAWIPRDSRGRPIAPEFMTPEQRAVAWPEWVSPDGVPSPAPAERDPLAAIPAWARGAG